MRTRSLPLLCALALLLWLGACTRQAPAPSQAPETPPATPEPAARYDFKVLPVTEEGIRTLYGWEGYEVRRITPFEEDYLVEYDPNDGAGTFTLLSWVFGNTGRRVQLCGMTEFTSYEITGPGQVRYSTSGLDAGTPWKGLPETRTVLVLGDKNGQVSPHFIEFAETSEPAWLDPEQPLSMGFWSDGGLAPGGRWYQLYDARIDADGLSFSFIPNGDSAERFQSFFPACTTIPCFDTQYDPADRAFTLRLYNTSLASGGIGQEDLDWAGTGAYDGLSPYAFPEGGLGRDSHFLREVSIRQDGEDAVVTAKLTERAWRFTVRSSNLGGDAIPSFRLVFREYDWEQDER